MENNKDMLISINNLKKYFPLKKSSFLQKEKLYVKANDGITINIHRGETFGLVGESGCGKSTMGRVLLQLYPQTQAYIHRSYGRNTPYYPAFADTAEAGHVPWWIYRIPIHQPNRMFHRGEY